MTASSAPKRTRHWYAFSLRTLFVAVTMLVVFFGYHLNWIRQRHDVLQHWKYSGRELLSPYSHVSAPALLPLFGERGYGGLWKELPSTPNAAERAEFSVVKKLFPEAFIMYTVKGGGGLRW